MKIIQILLADKRFILSDNKWIAFTRLASDNNHAEILEWYLANFSQCWARKCVFNDNIVSASKKGNLKIVQLFLSNGFYDKHLGPAISSASQNGHLEIVELLLTIEIGGNVDYHMKNAMLLAIKNNYIKIVELLLKDRRINPKYLIDKQKLPGIIYHIYDNGILDVLQLLLADERIYNLLNENDPIKKIFG